MSVVNRVPSPLPPAGSSDLWKEAYENIRHDPDDSTIYADFREIVNTERGRSSDARLSSESGRKELLTLIDQRRENLAARRSSPKVQQAFNVVDKARTIVTLGAAANPFSTVAVAGLFIAFDMRKMYTDAAQAMLDIAIETAGIICRAGVESQEVSRQDPNEPQQLLDLRDRLRGDYVQLYRTVLVLTMRLVRTLSSKRRSLFSGWSDWPGDRQALEKMENRVIKSLDSISRWRINPSSKALSQAPSQVPSKPPNWGIPGRNELHNAARYGQTAEVYRSISSGRCGPEILNGKTERGWTPLMFAVENGHYDIMDMLLECKGIDINVTNSIGRTALYMAAMKDRVAMVRRLLRMNAMVDVRDNRGRTAWLMIAMPGHLECLRLLRAAGAQLNQTTAINGYSALHGAVEGDQLEVVRWLLEQGIAKDIRMTNGKFAGMNAAEMAKALDRSEILDVLSQRK